MASGISVRPAAGTTVTWSPGPLNLGQLIDEQHNQFQAGGVTVTVNVNGDFARLELNAQGNNLLNFGAGDFLLQTSRPRDILVLTFTPPVRAAATQLAALGVSNPTPFKAVVQGKLADGTDTDEFTIEGVTTSLRDDSAPCLGISCAAGEAPIQSMAFSVEPRGPVNAIRRMGINQVTCVAAAVAAFRAAAPPSVAARGKKPAIRRASVRTSKPRAKRAGTARTDRRKVR